MKNIALVLATLCIFASASTLFQAPAFVQLKKTPFGNSLTALVEMNMQFTGKLNGIWDVLNQIEAELVAQSACNDSQIAAKRDECATQLATLSEILNGYEADFAAAQSEYDSLVAQQAETAAWLSEAVVALAQNEAQLSADQLALSEENHRYSEAARDYSEAIAACEEAISILNGLVVEVGTFIQSKAKFNGVVALLQTHLAKQTSSFVKPVLSVLAELSSAQTVNQAQLTQVISLINQLIAELQAQQAVNESTHTATVTALNNSIDSLTEVISEQQAQIADWRGFLGWLADRLRDLADLLDAIAALRTVIQGQIASTHAACDQEEVDYAQAKSDVDAQLATLAAVKEYFEQVVVPAVENVDDSAYEDALVVEA